jgi:eukaryotic-like serine/threonine-protein kinase
MFDSRRTKLKKTLIIAILLAALALAGCAGTRGWPGTVSEGGTLYVATMDGRVLALNPDSGSRKWDWQPTAKQGGQTASFLSCGAGGSLVGGLLYGTPAIANGLVYVAFHTGMVYAIDAVSGTQKWDYDLRSTVSGGVAVDNNTVFIGSSNGNLSALDAGNGSLKWGFSAENEVWATPAVVDGVVYFGSLDHSLYALNAADGTKKWAFKTGGGIASTPLVVEGVIYFGSFDNKFYAIDADTGMQKWVFEGAGNWFWSQAAYNNGTIYAGCLDHNVYAIDAGNGTLVWPKPFDAGSLVKASPVITGGMLAVASEVGKVYGLDLKTGEKKWEFDNINSKVLSPLCAAGDTVYINSEDNKLYALNGETGRQVWGIPLTK